MCFIGTLQAIAVTFVMEHKPSVWAIGWDMNLLAAAYAVILSLSTHTHTRFVFEICLGNIDEVMRLLLFQCLGDCDIEHLILCPRNSDKEERSSFCYCL
jgi:hypothetical protein